jgi:hypothetical protein
MKLISILTTLLIGSSAFSQCLVNLNDNLVGDYPFNGNANDNSLSSVNGVVYGATLTNDRFGNDSSAYSFNGSNYIDFPTFSTTNPQLDSITISFWMKTNISQNSTMMLYGGTNSGISVNIAGQTSCGFGNGNFLALLNNTGNSGGCISGFSLKLWSPTDTSWKHIVIKRYQSTTTIYFNSQLKYTSSIGINSPITSFVIGSYYTGLLDDFKIFQRALNSCEIDSLYNSPNPISLKEIKRDYDYIYNYQNIIKSNINTTGLSIKIFDLFGQVVLESQLEKEIRTNLNDGIYIVQVLKNNVVIQTKKLLINQ